MNEPEDPKRWCRYTEYPSVGWMMDIRDRIVEDLSQAQLYGKLSEASGVIARYEMRPESATFGKRAQRLKDEAKELSRKISYWSPYHPYGIPVQVGHGVATFRLITDTKPRACAAEIDVSGKRVQLMGVVHELRGFRAEIHLGFLIKIGDDTYVMDSTESDPVVITYLPHDGRPCNTF